jgi:hypothetical protein
MKREPISKRVHTQAAKLMGAEAHEQRDPAEKLSPDQTPLGPTAATVASDGGDVVHGLGTEPIADQCSADPARAGLSGQNGKVGPTAEPLPKSVAGRCHHEDQARGRQSGGDEDAGRWTGRCVGAATLLDLRWREKASWRARAFFAELLRLAQKGVPDPGYDRLTAAFNCSTATIGRCLEEQQRLGWITTQRRATGNALIEIVGLAIPQDVRNRDSASGAKSEASDSASGAKSKKDSFFSTNKDQRNTERERADARGSHSCAGARLDSLSKEESRREHGPRRARKTEHGMKPLPSEWKHLSDGWSGDMPTVVELSDQWDRWSKDGGPEPDDDDKRELALAVLKEEVLGIASGDAELDCHNYEDDDELVKFEFKKFVADVESKRIQSADWFRAWSKWIIGAVQYRKKHEQQYEQELERRDGMRLQTPKPRRVMI